MDRCCSLALWWKDGCMDGRREGQKNGCMSNNEMHFIKHAQGTWPCPRMHWTNGFTHTHTTEGLNSTTEFIRGKWIKPERDHIPFPAPLCFTRHLFFPASDANFRMWRDGEKTQNSDFWGMKRTLKFDQRQLQPRGASLIFFLQPWSNSRLHRALFHKSRHAYLSSARRSINTKWMERIRARESPSG